MLQNLRWLMPLLVLAMMVGFTYVIAEENQPSANLNKTNAEETNAVIDPARIEGHAKCVDCHKNEVKALLHSKHSTRAFDLLRAAPTSREYAKKLGIRPADIASKSMCVNCHATPRQDLSGHRSIIAGVSCESCHNASGGADGWLNSHAVYGPVGTRREDEKDEHRQRRREECRQAGQLGSSELYHLVKRCFQCHVVPNEALAEAGHNHGERFLLTERVLGEVRHNFVLSGQTNAEASTLWTDPLHNGPGRTAAGRKRVLFIVGQLVDLEVSLRNLATATDENDFSELMMDRVGEAYELLTEELLEELEETELPEVERATEIVEPVWGKLDDDGFDPDDRPRYLAAAKIIAEAAKTFSIRDGNKLAELDALELIPEGPFKGVFQP